MVEKKIKKLKGTLTQVRLIDASFIWTEPHSRRIKIKLVVQKEIQEGAVLEQIVPVSYFDCFFRVFAGTLDQSPWTVQVCWSQSKKRDGKGIR